MEVCKGSSWIQNLANIQIEHGENAKKSPSLQKIGHTPIASTNRLQWVQQQQHGGPQKQQQQHWESQMKLQKQGNVVQGNHHHGSCVQDAVTTYFGRPTQQSTWKTYNNFKYSHHGTSMIHLFNGCYTKSMEESNNGAALHCESTKSLKDPNGVQCYLAPVQRDVEGLHSALWVPKDDGQTAEMVIPGGGPLYQWGYSRKDLLNLRKPGTVAIPLKKSSGGDGRAMKWQAGVAVGDDMPPKYQDDDPLKQVPQRRCGILLHPTSLPGPHGIGDLGQDAYAFLDWLKETGCTVWQVLPLVPPGRRGGEDGSPYAGADANCGNTLLISLERLVKDGLLEPSDLPKPVPVKRMNSTKVAAVKDPLVSKAAAKLVSMSSGKLREDFEAFRKDPKISSWVEDAALFAAIDQSTSTTPWWTWPSHLRDRDPNAMKSARNQHKGLIDTFVAAQFLFQRQWQALHQYATEAGIRIVGDMPIYVGGHSADVWAHRSLFDLDPKTGVPLTVSGVPPDAFSATGQRWGSPLYNWKEMSKDKYAWWATRILRAYDLFDVFRIDHFRGFAAYWAIPYAAPTAMSGKWVAGPGKPFFTAIKEAVGKRLDLVAEDLGVITTDVVSLRKELKAPGMAVLQFAHGGGNTRNPHLPHNHEIDQVVYPGTHDNDTCVGWWKKATEDEKESMRQYSRFRDDSDVHWEFIRAATASVARTAIIPMQDVMGLDNNARMNIPATQAGNWGWRVGESDVFLKLDNEKKRLRKFLFRYNRLTPEFQEKCKAEKVANKKLDMTTTTKDTTSDASSMAKTTGKSLGSLSGIKVEGDADKGVDKAKDKFEKGVDKTKENVEKGVDKGKDAIEKAKEKSKEKAKDALGTFEKLKEKLKEKATKPFEKLKEKTTEKPKDEKPKEKPKDSGKDKGKDDPKKK